MRRAWLLCATLVLASPAVAQRTRHAPLVSQLPLGARAMAMGGTTAATRDAEAALGNPALAGPGPITGLALARYHDGANGGAMGTSTAIGVIGVGMAVSYLDYGAVQEPLCATCPVRPPVNDDALLHDGGTRGLSLAGAFALSMTFKGFRWGAAATYQEERVDASRVSVAAVTLGASRDNFYGGTSLGIALQNLGPSLRFAEGRAHLPSRLAVGLTKNFFPNVSWLDIATAGGVAVRRDGFVSASLGAEFSYVPLEGIAVALRGGARRAELQAQRPLTAGLGLSVDRFALDYAWEQMREGGGAHRVGVRIR